MADKVAVIGATGGTGIETIKGLLARNVAVRALVRSREKAEQLFTSAGFWAVCCDADGGPSSATAEDAAATEGAVKQATPSRPMVELIVGNITDAESLRKLMLGCRAVIITTGTIMPLGIFNTSNSPYIVDYLGAQNVVNAAKALIADASAATPSIKIVLVSSVGLSRPFRLVTFVLQTFCGRVMKWKKAGENVIRASGLPFCIVRPALLKSNQLQDPPRPSAATPGPPLPNLVVDQGDRIDGWIERADVAFVCIEAALESVPEAKQNVTFELIASESRVNDSCSEPSRDIAKLLAHLKPDGDASPPARAN